MAILNKNQFYYLDSTEKILRENTSVWYMRTDFDTVDSYYFEFKHANAFEVFPLETLIELTEIERIKNKELTLVLCNSHEAFHAVVEGIYKDIVKRFNIPPEQVVLISESADILTEVKRISELYNIGEIKAEWINIFENTIRRQKLELLLSEPIKKSNINKIFPKKFLNFNRRWRLHRPSLIALLCANNLLEHGHVSLGECDDRANWSTVWHSIKERFSQNQEITNLLLNNEEKILNLPMMYLDYYNLMENLPDLEQRSNRLYNETYFSVVSETNYFTKSLYSHATECGRFLSEKTFKPIAQSHPFIIVSVPNSLDALRNLGYKSFSPWIDESYDTEPDDAIRLLKIVAEIKRLSELSPEQLTKFLHGVHDICTFNLGVLLRKNPAENIRKLN